MILPEVGVNAPVVFTVYTNPQPGSVIGTRDVLPLADFYCSSAYPRTATRVGGCGHAEIHLAVPYVQQNAGVSIVIPHYPCPWWRPA